MQRRCQIPGRRLLIERNKGVLRYVRQEFCDDNCALLIPVYGMFFPTARLFLFSAEMIISGKAAISIFLHSRIIFSGRTGKLKERL